MSYVINGNLGPLKLPEVLPVQTWIERLRPAPLAERLAEQYRPSPVSGLLPVARVAALEALVGEGR